MKALLKEGRMSGLEINNKGKNMKKFFVVLLAVCLIATFISCSNEAKMDERVNVSFGVDQSRSLSSSASYADFSTLDWYYKASTESQFDYGEKESWTKLDNGLDTTLELSQGIWSFELCAVGEGNNPTSEETVLIYSGSRSGVLVQKGDKAQTITIDVVPGGSGNGTIIIRNNIVVNKKTADGSYVATTVKANNWEVKALSSTSDFETKIGVFSATEPVDKKIEEVPAGDYKVTVWYKDVLDETAGTYVIRATEPIDITVYANSTITVKGSIDEETQAVVIKPISTYQSSASGDLTPNTEAVVSFDVTPAMTSSTSQKTTVTIPASMIKDSTEDGKVKLDLDVTVTPAKEASSDNSFVASSGSAVAAAIDINLSLDRISQTTGFDSPVKVETYVAKNLADFTFGFPGETWTKKESLAAVTAAKDYYYDSTEGKLTFLTDHFSSFIVETSSAAIIGDTAYATLAAAIDAVVNNETIVLLKDVSLTSVLEIGKSIVIDGNGHNISNTANRVIRITKEDLDVKLYNLGVISKCTAGSDVRGISFDKISSGSSLLLDGCTVSASFYAINILPEVSNLDITIKNGTVAAGWAAINSYSNNSTFTIENSTLRGLNDKGESEWNNFATIVFDGNGLYNKENIGVNGSGNTMTIKKSTVYASSESSNNQAWLAIQYGARDNNIIINNTHVRDESGEDQTDNIVILPFVGWEDGVKYDNSYDVHSNLKIDNENLQICYHGEIDYSEILDNGFHVPFEGCEDIEWSNVVTITPAKASTTTWNSDTLYYLAPGQYNDFSAYLHGKENVGFCALPEATFTKVVIGYHAGQDLSAKQNSTLTIKGFNVDGELMVNSADQKVVIEGNTAALITLKTHQFDDMKIQVINNTLTGGSDKASQQYGIYIVPNTTNYDLNISGNTFSNIYDHAIAVQGNGDGSAITAANSIIVKDNQFESYGLNGNNGRAAFKIWADTKYAPTANGGEINSDASSLIQNIHDNNTFSSSLGENCVLGNFYGILVQFNNQGTN